mgnify:CR=1 FL=1
MIAIIGAGMAGLACARELADSGRQVTVFDKGRGLGGRIATRRTDFGSFDHGAQYATARDEAFRAVLGRAVRSGQAQVWPDISDDRDRIVGTPGMSALVRPLADGLDIRSACEVRRLKRDHAGWHVDFDDGRHEGPFGTIVLTPPAPQARQLLEHQDGLFPELDRIVYAPCWTLMAAFDWPLGAEPVHRGERPLSWIACNSGKPQRRVSHETWIAQADAAWSREHLEDDKAAVAEEMLRLMMHTLGVSTAQPAYLAAHRWRYARVETALETPCLFDPDRKIGIAGDGMLGGRIEAAFDSGKALAQEILEVPA